MCPLSPLVTPLIARSICEFKFLSSNIELPVEFIAQMITDKLYERAELGASICSVGSSLPKCTMVFCLPGILLTLLRASIALCDSFAYSTYPFSYRL